MDGRTEGQTDGQFFLENNKSFFSSLMGEYMSFFKKSKFFKVGRTDEPIFLKMPKAFFPSLMGKNTIFFKRKPKFLS